MYGICRPIVPTEVYSMYGICRPIVPTEVYSMYGKFSRSPVQIPDTALFPMISQINNTKPLNCFQFVKL